jgi:hypothetical protein
MFLNLRIGLINNVLGVDDDTMLCNSILTRQDINCITYLLVGLLQQLLFFEDHYDTIILKNSKLYFGTI